MSKVAGEKYLNKLLTPLLEKNKVYQTLKQDFRAMLDSSIHVLDISAVSLESNLAYIEDADTFEYGASYTKFISILQKLDMVKTYTNEAAFYDAVKAKSGSNPLAGVLGTGAAYISDTNVIITTRFGYARAVISKACEHPSMKYDKYFGVTNRARSLGELEFQGYEIGPNIASIEEQEVGISAHKCRAPGGPKSTVRYFNEVGLELDKTTKEVRKRELSIFDLGHTFQGRDRVARDSPLSSKLEASLKVRGNQNIKAAVAKALENLADIQAEIEYTYTNTIPKKLLGGKGVVVLSLHVYNRNNEYARKEGAIYSKLIADMKNELIAKLTPSQLAKIPGSNTLEQDIAAVVTNKIVLALGGKPIKLKEHEVPTGKANTSQSKKSAKVVSDQLSLPAKKPSKSVPMRSVRGQFYSLASLQRLLDATLAQKIKENMGKGSRRDILNLRSGRLAESAKVERMSQSREGMITAFYTYMKNPYATFSEGGRQEFPRSRDPKLLIAKSIREIAASQVANRMRAVLI